MTRDEGSLKIGLMGGTFNPVHLAHLVAAQDARELFGLDQVWFIPCSRPPHKSPGWLASGADRAAMLKLALKGVDWARVSEVELKRGGVSYTVETLRELRRLHPAFRFHFILGTDSLVELHQWREIDALLKLCRFVTIGRPGWDPGALNERSLGLVKPWPARLLAQVRTGHMIGISSTEIRKRAAKGLGLSYLVPDAVARYITKKALYAPGRLHDLD
jgi:nicotinate-nucleotide adenylyltransferase